MDDAEQPDEREQFLQRLFDEVIRPQLQELAEQMDGVDPEDLANADIDLTQLDIELPENIAEAHCEAIFLGSRDGAGVQETLQRIQEHLQEGLSLEYILHELTDVGIRGINRQQIGNMHINLVSMEPSREDDVQTPSADELRKLFER